MAKYSKAQIAFLIKTKKANNWGNTRTIFNAKYGSQASQSALTNIYYKSVPKTHKVEDTRNKFIQLYANFVKRHNFLPTTTVFCKRAGVTSSTLYKHFDSYDDLEHEARLLYPKTFKNIVSSINYTPEALDALKTDTKKHRRFFVTSAVSGCAPNVNALKAVQRYCKINNAKLLILPCSDPANTKEHKDKLALSHKIPIESVVFADLKLNDKLKISSIKMSAKHINPLTGITRMVQSGKALYSPLPSKT